MTPRLEREVREAVMRFDTELDPDEIDRQMHSVRQWCESEAREPLSHDEVRHFNVMQWIAVALLVEIVIAWLVLRWVIGA